MDLDGRAVVEPVVTAVGPALRADRQRPEPQIRTKLRPRRRGDLSPGHGVMSRDGYTLVEMAVALAVLGLAIGGLLGGMHVADRFEASSARALGEARLHRQVQDGLSRLLAAQGPFFSDDAAGLLGSERAFSFACDAGACSGRIVSEDGRTYLKVSGPKGTASTITLPHGAQPQFAYAGDRTTGDSWPARTLPRQKLELVTLAESAAGPPLASVRLWADEPLTCRFDVIAQGCRQ
jgi:prepilin-type N-terminal cleavage/methylation domain-containing protein